MTKPISDSHAVIETMLVWNRAYKNKALLNFVRVAREVMADTAAPG